MTRIRIPADAAQVAIVEFVKTSSLAFCTEVEIDDHGATVVSRWDPTGFSSGERALWGVLESLCTGHIRTVLDRCDEPNRAALARVMDELTGVPAW